MTPAIWPLTRLTPRPNVPLGRPISASTLSEVIAELRESPASLSEEAVGERFRELTIAVGAVRGAAPQKALAAEAEWARGLSAAEFEAGQAQAPADIELLRAAIARVFSKVTVGIRVEQGKGETTRLDSRRRAHEPPQLAELLPVSLRRSAMSAPVVVVITAAASPPSTRRTSPGARIRSAAASA